MPHFGTPQGEEAPGGGQVAPSRQQDVDDLSVLVE
jgi:hypothetical protein